MEDAPLISHDAAIVTTEAPAETSGKHRLVSLSGLGQAFRTVAVGGVALALIGGLVHGRMTGKDLPDRIEMLRQRANLSFLPPSGAEREALRNQLAGLEYQAFIQQEALRRRTEQLAQHTAPTH